MNFNDTNYYSYYYRMTVYGTWKVYHIENDNEVMDMCFSTEENAKSYATTLNLNEAKRVEDAKKRMEDARKRLTVEPTPYYSITGYYGD